MFDSEKNPLPAKPFLPRWLVLGISAGSVTVLLVFIATTTSIFTRGEIDDLPLEEREVLSRIQKNGVRIVSRPSTSFGAPPQIVPYIIWQYSAGEYAVTAVTILNADDATILPELQKLTRLKEIRVPYLDAADTEKLKRKFPKVVVKRAF